MSAPTWAAAFHASTATAGLVRLPRPVFTLRGRDALDVCHRLSTNALADLPEGAARETVFCTPKGRLIDRVRVLRWGGECRLVGAPGPGTGLAAHLDRYIISEDALVESAAGALLGCTGPKAAELTAALTALPASPNAVTADGECLVWIEPAGAASVIWWHGPSDTVAAREAELRAHGAVVMDHNAAESWRVAMGWAAAGREITGDWNPLELGAGPAIDFRKGCYIGQEVVARLWYYEKQQRRLMRVRLTGDPGALPAACADDAGTCTSAAPDPTGGWAALAYLRPTVATPGTPVRVGDASGTVRDRVGADPDAPPPPAR